MKSLRVLSYNIHKGFTIGNQNYVLDLIREGIREQKADLVFLQEVVGDHEDHRKHKMHSLTTKQFEFLADGVWSHFAYGKNAVYQKGHHGNAILSLLPISKTYNLDLSTSRFEKRGMLHAIIDNPDSKKVERIHVMSLHLSLLANGRKKQIAKICKYIKTHTTLKNKIILAGDFNDWSETLSQYLKDDLSMIEVFQEFQGQHAKTFPSLFPFLALDRIYIRGFKIKKVKLIQGGRWSKLSDHLALLTEINC